MNIPRRVLFGAAALLVQCGAAAAIDFGAFKSDLETDRWLCKASATYAAIVKDLDSRKGIDGYRFVTRKDIPAGMAVRAGRVMEIQLNWKLTGAVRITTLMFEMANAMRYREHEAIDRAADTGLIRTAEEFGLAHEIYEYEALRLHRRMLIEIASSHGPLPKAFFRFVTPAPRSAAAYRLPNLYDYLKAQKASGHTAHYYRHFRLRKGRQPAQDKASHARPPGGPEGRLTTAGVKR